jgi:hypothetical protein
MRTLTAFRFTDKKKRFKVAALMILLQQSEKFTGLMDGRYSHSNESSVAGALPDTLNFSGWLGPDEETWDYLVVDNSVLADTMFRWVIGECESDTDYDDPFNRSCGEIEDGHPALTCIAGMSDEEFHAHCATIPAYMVEEVDGIQHTDSGC